MTKTHHEQFMQLAVDIARDGSKHGSGGPFGAVIVFEGKVVGKGCNKVTSSNDPTAHAEVVAIRDACHNLKTFSLKGAQIYTSCEPCPMCLAALYWARIDQIFFGATQEDAALIGFDDAFFYAELKKSAQNRLIPALPLLREPCVQVFKEWHQNPNRIPY